MTAFPSSDPHLERLLSSLEADYNPDYWADQIKTEIAGELSSLDDLGWDQLDVVWAQRTAGWRIRIAEVLALVDHPRATVLLIRMLASQEPEVGRAVAEALLELNYQWSPEVSLRADLERHLLGVAPGARRPLERLLGRLPT